MKLVILIGTLCLTLVLGNKYSQEELKALAEFSSLVKSELPHEYMKENDYLINWIRSAPVPHRNQNAPQEFDLKKAKENLVANLAWRKQYGIDSILNEDFTDMYKVYPPLEKPIIDKDGNTVYKFAIKDMDLSKLTKGLTDRFTLFGYSVLERTARGAKDNKSQHTTWLIDARHYNPDLHFGPSGKTVYPKVFKAIEEHYPTLMKRIIYINAPPSFSEMSNTVKSSLTPKLREEFKVFGENEAEWVAYLEKFMDKDQIPKSFFGNKYTREETKALSEFSTLVKSELPQEYMKKDDYLINWIKSAQTPHSAIYNRPQEFDLKKAKENLDKNLAWRKENAMDSILNEDFTDMYKVYPPLERVIVDKEGGTITTFSFGDLDLTKISGKMNDRLSRYGNFILEKIARNTRDSRSQYTTWIIDARHFNPEVHFPPNAHSVYNSFFRSIEAYYPSLLHRLIYINAPVSFSATGNTIKSAVSPRIKDELKIFGENEAEWVAYLEKFMDRDQIPKSFFGSNYTEKEIKALDEFSKLVKSELPQEYMKKDDYLINWIRSAPLPHSLKNKNLPQEFDLKKAKQNLEDNLAWRKKYGMDNIFNENFADMFKVFPPLKRGIIAKDGGTVHTFDLADLDITMLSQKSIDRFTLYGYYILEKMARDTRENGSPYTTAVVNARQFNPNLHLGLKGKTVYPAMFRAIETHYPSMMKRLIYVNAPASFSETTDIIKSSLGPKIKEEFKVFGQNEAEWVAYIEKFMDKDQIPTSFFGSKYTKAEAKALSEFSALVKSELPQEYMKKDDYLIKWVRSVAVRERSHGGLEVFDLDKAKANLDKNLAWRKQNDMDNILEEDFVDMQKVYPYIGTPAIDKDGGTVYTFDFGKYDPTKVADTERIARFFYYLLEKMSTTTMNYKSPHTSLVVDARHYNPAVHSNRQTKSLYSNLFESIEAHYPLFVKRIVFINSPESFSEISRIARSSLNPEIKTELKVFGQNQAEWGTYLEKFMDHEQIPKTFFQ